MNCEQDSALEIDSNVPAAFGDNESLELTAATFPASGQAIRTIEQLDAFVENHHEGIRNLVRSECYRTPERAEDTAQELYPKLADFLATSAEGIREPWAFIRTAVRRMAIDEVRRLATLSRRFVPFYEESTAPLKPATQSEETQELAQAVRHFVSLLDDRERAVVTRIFLEGRRGREVARELALSESYVAEIKAAALSQLRKLLQQADLLPGSSGIRQQECLAEAS